MRHTRNDMGDTTRRVARTHPEMFARGTPLVQNPFPRGSQPGARGTPQHSEPGKSSNASSSFSAGRVGATVGWSGCSCGAAVGSCVGAGVGRYLGAVRRIAQPWQLIR